MNHWIRSTGRWFLRSGCSHPCCRLQSQFPPDYMSRGASRPSQQYHRWGIGHLGTRTFKHNQNDDSDCVVVPPRPLSDTTLAEVCRQWGQHSQLLADSDFPLVEPILALRSATMQTLLARAGDPDSTLFLSSVLTNHLMELCQLARNAGNTQVQCPL